MCSRYNWAIPEDCRPVDRVAGLVPLVPATGLDVVRLRRGGSVNPVLERVARCGKIQITGPPGCGKSTLLPRQLAGTGSLAVVHLVPHPLQAMQLGAALNNNGGVARLSLGDLFAGRSTGVLVIAYCHLWSYLLRQGLKLLDIRRDVLFYCDESHESDAGTYAFVKYACSDLCPNRVTLVSATLDGQEFSAEEALCACEEKTVGVGVEEAVEGLLPCVIKQPEPRVIVFIDRDDQAARVRAVAERLGFQSYSLHSRSEPSEYQTVMASNASGKPWLCTLDSSYRTGFNFLVNVVVDSAEVGYVSYTDGKKRYRPAFGFELYQARGRLGRDVISGAGVFVRIRGPISDMLTRIEGAEMPLASVLAAAFGLVLPELQIAGLGNHRKVLCNYSDLNGRMPISLLPNAAFVGRVVDTSSKPSEEGSQKYKSKDVTSTSDLVHAFAKLDTKLSEVRISVKVGSIYCVPGNMETFDRSPMFPNGARSVMDALSNGRLFRLLGLMSTEDKELLLRIATFEMSQASIKHIASLQFVTEVSELAGRFSSEQKALLIKLQEDLAISEAGYKRLAEILILLQRESPIDVIELPNSEVADVIEELRVALTAEFDSKAIKKPGRSVLPTLDDVLPGGRNLVELPHTVVREQYNARALPGPGMRRQSSNSQGSSGASGRSIPDWERRMFRIKKFDGVTGKLVKPD